MLDSSTIFSGAFSPVHEPLNVQIVIAEKYQSNMTNVQEIDATKYISVIVHIVV